MTSAIACICKPKSIKIGDYVWEDINDGVQGTDSKEKPMANVLVSTNLPGRYYKIITDVNGHYEFGN